MYILKQKLLRIVTYLKKNILIFYSILFNFYFLINLNI